MSKAHPMSSDVAAMAIPYIGPQAPTYGTPDAAGGDLVATEFQRIGVGERKSVKTGFKAAIPPGYVGLLFSRSGQGRNSGISLANSVGVIDSDYRGEIIPVLINHGDKPFTVQPGERVAQLVIVPFIRPEWVPVETLDETERGEGGFGSTDQTPANATGNGAGALAESK